MQVKELDAGHGLSIRQTVLRELVGTLAVTIPGYLPSDNNTRPPDQGQRVAAADNESSAPNKTQ